MFVATYPAFHRQFPGIIVEPHEMRVHNQQLQIAQGYVDLGLVTLSEQQKLADLQYDHIRYEPCSCACRGSIPWPRTRRL